MRRRWLDLLLGISLGLAIGLGVLIYFVFVHSEGTIDAPQINEGQATTGQATPPPPSNEKTGTTESAGPAKEKTPTKAKPAARPVPVVPVIGGAPPTDAGPKQLTFRKGEKVRFEIETAEPFSFEIKGLNIKQSIEGSSIVSFKATKAGQFPVIATATLIGVADLRIKPSR